MNAEPARLQSTFKAVPRVWVPHTGAGSVPGAEQAGKQGTRMTTSRRSDIQPFIAMDVLARANALEAAGKSVLHLEVGEPGSTAPQCVLAAARAALDSGKLGYTEALGRMSLRQRIARHYGQSYGVELDPARVVVTTGSSAGFNLAFLALFDAGARVGVAEPGIPPIAIF